MKTQFLFVCTISLVLALVQTSFAQSQPALSPVERDTPLVIEGGTLFDGTGADPFEISAIVIANGRIQEVRKAGQASAYPAGARVIQAGGKYILPGLIDGHVHLRGWDLELYINHGVTTVMDTGNDTDWILFQRDGIAKGRMKGPRIFASGTVINGVPPDAQRHVHKAQFVYVSSTESARETTRRLVAAGVDFIKLYAALTKEMMKAIVEEAHAAGLPAIGHVSTTPWDAVEVGYNSIIHIGQVVRGLGKDSARGELEYVASIDFDKADKLIQGMVSKGIYFDHVLRTTWEFAHKDRFQQDEFDLLLNNIHLRYVPLNIRLGILKEYNNIDGYWYQDVAQERRDLAWKAYRNTVEFVRRFARAGGKLTTGSDTLSTGGLSLHQTLEILVKEVGLTPAEALLTVTKNPAALYRVSKDLGSVERGKIADLVIVSKNPLAEIRNTRLIEHVIQNGRVVDISYHADFVNPIPRPVAEHTSHLFPSPVVENVTPRKAREGDADVNIKVEGTGFIPYSVVHFDGKPLRTTYENPFGLRAVIPADLLKSAGTYPVTVVNPTGAVGTTSGLGQSALVMLGARDEKSNEYNFMVGFK